MGFVNWSTNCLDYASVVCVCVGLSTLDKRRVQHLFKC